MDKKDIRKFILDNLDMDVRELQSEIAQQDLFSAWDACCIGSQSIQKTLADLYAWAKADSYVKMGDAADYEISTPFASARVKGNSIRVYDLEPYHIRCTPLAITQFITAKGIVRFLADIPKLVETIEVDRKYIEENTTPLRQKNHNGIVAVEDKQNIIGQTVRRELSGYTLSTKRKRYQVIVSVSLNNMVMDYPIQNKDIDNLPSIIENLKTSAANFQNIPFGTKLSSKN